MGHPWHQKEKSTKFWHNVIKIDRLSKLYYYYCRRQSISGPKVR